MAFPGADSQMDDSLSLSQQIAMDFGSAPNRKKRAKRSADLYDDLDIDMGIGDNQGVINSSGGSFSTNAMDLQQSVEFYGVTSTNPQGMGASMEFVNSLLNSDAMDTDSLKVSGTFPQADGSFAFSSGVSGQPSNMFGAFGNPGDQKPSFDDMPWASQQYPANMGMGSDETLARSPTESWHNRRLDVAQPPAPEPHTAPLNVVAGPKQQIQEAKEALDKLRWNQKQLLTQGIGLQSAEMHQLSLEHKSLSANLTALGRTLDKLRAYQILSPPDIHLLMQSLTELELLVKQLEVFMLELRAYVQIAQGQTSMNQLQSIGAPAALVITQHPFPKSVKQNKPMDDGITIRLLTGAACNVWPAGSVTAVLVTDWSTRSKKGLPTVQVLNNVKELDGNSLTVQFTELLFPQGTRKKTIHLKFQVSAQIQLPGASKPLLYHLESPATPPFIVKTNENQWDESEGLLLKSEVFAPPSTTTESTWCQFCNALQRRYLLATKQDPLAPIRPLALQDMHYLFQVKFSSNIGVAAPANDTPVSSKVYDNFWAWFGPGLHKIRYQRHMCPLWVRGLICGFLQRGETERVLQSAPPGSFLLRLSERVEGKFALDYVVLDNNERKICHYLISSDDVIGPKKTLPDFLGHAKNFRYLIQMSQDIETDTRMFTLCEKDQMLAEFYSKKAPETVGGYEDKLRL